MGGWWNHFADKKYAKIMFKDVPIGGKFRQDFFKGKRRRSDIICIRTGELTYMELKSKKERALLDEKGLESYECFSFDQPNEVKKVTGYE